LTKELNPSSSGDGEHRRGAVLDASFMGVAFDADHRKWLVHMGSPALTPL
jgi:hypothetical protein